MIEPAEEEKRYATDKKYVISTSNIAAHKATKPKS